MCSVDSLFKQNHMSVMPLGPTMHGKWDPPQLSSYKMDRPAYSTPPPVENTPSNNECRMVELRGSKVASFSLGCDEYICLPQAFDLFLKHLVGGLHTVYTKLKRLSIIPVVCNVEQVRILRGLGAIQPGVNRCKLITRKDFEILYQDCTTASRPGRPPKRYPVLPPTTDLMSHHANMRSNNTLLNQTDLSAFHKRMRLGHGMDQSHDRRASGSPPKDADKPHSNVPGLPTDLHNSPTANLAYLQAIRHQYQQAAVSGLHNGLDPQQINPALAPFMMMSHPALFSSGIPPTSMAMLNHINQIAQNQAATGAITSAAAAAAQLAAGGGSLHPSQIPSQGSDNHSTHDKDSDGEDMHTPRSYNNTLGLSNGIGSDGRTSPISSVGSLREGGAGHMSDNSDNPHSFDHSFKDSAERNTNVGDLSDAVRELAKASKMAPPSDDEMKPLETSSISSMQTLLTNIQGLLKVAADNASLQEKHASIEIAELKLKLNQERQLRERAETKLKDCEREKVEAEKRLYREKKENKKLHGRVVSMQQILGHDVNNNTNDGDVELTSPQTSPPSSNGVIVSDVHSESSTPPASVTSPLMSHPVTSSFDSNMFSARIAANMQQAAASASKSSSPSSSPTSMPLAAAAINLNNSNNHVTEERKSPDYGRRSLMTEPRVPDLAIDLGMSRQERPALQDQRLFFKSSLLFQPAASQ